MNCHSREGGNPVIAKEKSKEDKEIAKYLLGPSLCRDDGTATQDFWRLVSVQFADIAISSELEKRDGIKIGHRGVRAVTRHK